VLLIEARQSSPVGALPSLADVTADRIVVVQPQGPQQWLEREPLDDQRPERHAEGGEDDQVALRKICWKRHRRGECHDPTHPGPGNHEPAPDRRTQHRTWRPEAATPVAPAHDGIKGHMPSEAHDNHRRKDCAGDTDVTDQFFAPKATKDGPDLQANGNEGQDVQCEPARACCLPSGWRKEH
jgi:hypothetical protein